ncbi:redox-active disulfide protein 2 [Halpernia sp.]|uniref:redox-active disulfide protein 2 n=1 Tax=Halpernia sp. TaxID=2782209 RepID=UPI003A936742
MKDNKLANVSTEKLLKDKKTIKALSGMLAAILILLLLISLFITFTKGFTPLLVIPIALLPILNLNFKNLKEIDKELKQRENSN